MANYFSTTSKGLEEIDVQGTLRKLSNQNVRLLNFYKEIPVSYVAKFVDYDREGVACLMCNTVQAKIMDIDQYTILRHLDYAFKAQVVGIRRHGPSNSANQQEILLSRFIPVEVFTDLRQLVRVVNDNPIDVTISGPDFELNTRMLDTSSNSFKAEPIANLPMDIEGSAQAKFILPLHEGPACIEADVVFLKESPDFQIFRMIVSRAQENVIMRYINQRQVEIIKELNLE
jgi:hypothetical protein